MFDDSNIGSGQWLIMMGVIGLVFNLAIWSTETGTTIAIAEIMSGILCFSLHMLNHIDDKKDELGDL